MVNRTGSHTHSRSHWDGRPHCRREGQEGTIIVFALLVVFLLAGLSSAFLVVSTTQSQSVNFQTDEVQTLFNAKAAIGLAMTEIDTGIDKQGSTPGDGLGVVSGTFAGGTYNSTVTLSGANYIITARGDIDYNKRGIQTVIAPVPSVPLPSITSEAAVGIFGDPTKMKLSLPGHPQSGDDETLDKYVHISGIDTSDAHQNLLGIGIQGADAYKSVMDKIAQKIADGNIPSTVFEGDPIVDYIIGDKKKKETIVKTSIGLVPTASLDATWWQDKAELLAEAVALVPADRTINASDSKIITNQTWGTEGFPEVTVVNAQRLSIESGATVQGAGTLIVNGDITIKQLSALKWTGTVIVTGGTIGSPKGNDALINNQRGTLNIDGTTVVLGTGKSKAQIKINDPSKNEDASTTFNGAVMVISGKEDVADKAEFKVNHGGVEMDGLLALIGDKVKLEIHKERADKQFNMDGSVMLAVPPDVKSTKADLKLKGYTSITYNSVKTKDAITTLMDLLTTYSVIPTTYSVVSWREVTPQ